MGKLFISFKKGTDRIKFAFINSCGSVEGGLKVGRWFYSFGDTFIVRRML